MSETNRHADAVDGLRDLIKLLDYDVAHALNTLDEVAHDESAIAIARRTYVRASGALFQGAMYNMKRVALEALEAGTASDFSIAETALLAEETYDLSDRGEAKTRTRFLPAASNLRFAFRCFARAHGSEYEADFEGGGWKSFKAAIEIRNRITHPQDCSSLEVSEDEVFTTKDAVYWFEISLKGLLKSCIESMQSESNPKGLFE